MVFDEEAKCIDEVVINTNALNAVTLSLSTRRVRGNLNLLDEIAQPVPSEARNLLHSSQ